LIQRDALATELCSRARTLNIAIAEFNQQLEPLVRAVEETQTHYNEAMESARTLANEISGPAQEQFDAKSERWQDSDADTQVRAWIEGWEMCLDDNELDLPEPLEEIDPEEHAITLKSGPGSPADLESVH
jgi:hypothetical protein